MNVQTWEEQQPGPVPVGSECAASWPRHVGELLVSMELIFRTQGFPQPTTGLISYKRMTLIYLSLIAVWAPAAWPLTSAALMSASCGENIFWSWRVFLTIVSSVRLDMDNMVLSQPESTDNQCQSDQFIVSGGNPVPALCGTLTGSHSQSKILFNHWNNFWLWIISVYIDMGLSNDNPVVLTVVTSGASFDRSFSVKVTQIECTSLSKGNTALCFINDVKAECNDYKSLVSRIWSIC